MEKHNSNSQTSKKYDLQNQRQTEMLAAAFFLVFVCFLKKLILFRQTVLDIIY